MGHGIGVQPGYRRVQVVKSELVHGLAQLGAHATHGPAFVGHQQAPGFLDALGYGIHIQWLDGTQVDHLDRDALHLQGFRRLQRQMHNLPGCCNRQVGTGACNSCHTKRHQMVARGYLTLGRKQRLGLQHQHRVAGAQGGFHQAFGVCRGRRHTDDEARNMCPHRVVHAAVVRPGRTHGTGTHTDHHRRVHLAVAHVAQFGRLQHDLARRFKQKVGKHQVGDTTHPGGRSPQARTGEAQLRNWCVDHPAGAEFLEQILGMREGAAALAGAFPKIKDQRVAPHLFGQAVAHCVQPAGADRDGTRCSGRQRCRRINRIGVNMLVYRGRIGLGRIARESNCVGHLGFHARLDPVELLLAGQAKLQQPVVAQQAYRVAFGPGIHFGLAAVAPDHGVALMVRHHAVGLDLQQCGALAGARTHGGITHYLPYRHQVVAVHRHTSYAVSRGTAGDLRV